jgi:hypothetical protein
VVEAAFALASGILIGSVFGFFLAWRQNQSLNETLSREIEFLRGVVDRRDSHEERIERVRYGLSEIRSDDRDADDPVPRDFLELLELFPNSMTKTLSWARKLRRQHVPWEHIVRLYKNSIEEQVPGFFKMKAERDVQRKRREAGVSDE